MFSLRYENKMAAPIGKAGKVTNITKRLVNSAAVKKFGDYVLQIMRDYKSSTMDIFKDARDRPIKAAFYITGLSAIGYLGSTNPDEDSFDRALVDASNDLLQVSDLVRNQTSDSHTQDLLEMRNKGVLKRMNLGVCSIMWRDNYGRNLSQFDSTCTHLKVPWKEFPERIVDIGVHGRWLHLEKAMIDYDVNENEFEGDMVR